MRAPQREQSAQRMRRRGPTRRFSSLVHNVGGEPHATAWRREAYDHQRALRRQAVACRSRPTGYATANPRGAMQGDRRTACGDSSGVCPRQGLCTQLLATAFEPPQTWNQRRFRACPRSAAYPAAVDQQQHQTQRRFSAFHLGRGGDSPTTTQAADATCAPRRTNQEIH
jgi:hypothetical protein